MIRATLALNGLNLDVLGFILQNLTRESFNEKRKENERWQEI